MKKIAILFINLIIYITLLSSCNKEKNREITKLSDNYYIYPIEESIGSFEIDDMGNLYYIKPEATDQVISYTDIDGNQVESPIMNSVLYSMDKEGNIIETFNLGSDVIIEFAINKNKIYYTKSEIIKDNNHAEAHSSKKTVIQFYEYSREDKTSNEIYKISNLDMVRDLKYADDKLFYLGIDNSKINKEFTLAGDEDYYYSGEVIGKLDLKTGIAEELPVEYPVSFALTLDNNLMIYGHDGEGGYYFTEYDVKEGTFSPKIYKDIGRFGNFAVYNKENSIVYTSVGTSTTSLAATNMEEDNVITEIMPFVGASSIICKGDYIYYANAKKTNRIERIHLKAYIRNEKTINMISSTNIAYTPFGCGYTLMREYPDAESFALSVLSQEPSYDIYFMSSRQSISYNIKDKGSFYPLNDVPGVMEYLEKCFPYIKEAATTDEGDIWMLPITVDMPVLLYNEILCRKHEIDLSEPMDFEEFVKALEALKQKEELENTFNISGYLVTEDIFYKYLRESKDLNTKEFIKLASMLKENFNYLKDNRVNISAPIVNRMLETGDIDNLLFDLSYYSEMQLRAAFINDGLRAGGLPHISSDQRNIATGHFLCVNPASKNLNAALNYISSLCEYTLSLNNTMLFQDRTRYPEGQVFDDLYKIYENGEIHFTLPNELFVSDYQLFLKDELDLHAFIEEANRKIDIFINE